jgi:hypothetical protein
VLVCARDAVARTAATNTWMTSAAFRQNSGMELTSPAQFVAAPQSAAVQIG